MMTLRECLREYLNHARARRFSPLTLRTKNYHILAFLGWLEMSKQVWVAERVQKGHLEAWQRHVTTVTTGQALPLKPRTINKYIESIRGFIKHLGNRGVLPGSVLSGLDYVREPRVLPSSVLNHDDLQRMLGHIDTTTVTGIRDRAMLELAYSAGLRAGEILGLDVAGVDWANGTALVTGKGSKQRVVPIGRTALGLAESYLKTARPFLVAGAGEQALFLDRRGRRMPYHTFRRLVHRYAERLGITMAVTPHTFRRSCTTELIRGGANLYHVKELLGHESLETLKHYTRLTIEDLKETHARCHPREREWAG